MQKIPLSVQGIKWLLLLKLLLILSAFGLIAFVVYTKPAEGFLLQFARYILSKTGNGVGLQIENPVFVLSYLFGYYISIVILTGLEYYFVSKRMQAGLWITLFFDFIFTIAGKRLPIISLFIFILGMIKSTRFYFSKNKNSPLLLDDESF